MADINPGDVLKTVFEFISEGQNVQQNVRHFRLGGLTPIPEGTVLDDMVLLAGEYMTLLQPLLTTGTQLSSIEVYLVDTVAETLIGDGDIGIFGTAGADRTAHGVAGMPVRQVKGSKGVSKVFIPGIAENFTTAGFLTATGIGYVLNAGVLLLTDIVAAQFGNTGEYSPGTWNSARLTPFLELTGDVVTKQVLAYQRRRKPGVGV